MASTSIIKFDKIKSLFISELINDSYQQVQLECKNGRRFILRGLRTNDTSKLETAIQIIKEDNEVNLSEWVETTPAEQSKAHTALIQKNKTV